MADTMRRPDGSYPPPPPPRQPGLAPTAGLRDRFAAALQQPPAAMPHPNHAGTGPAAVPGAVAAGTVTAGVLPVGFPVISELRGLVANRIAAESAGVVMNEEDRRVRGRALVVQVVSQWATDYAVKHGPLTRPQELAIQDAVFDDLFRAGRLQPLLDDPRVENILIDGFDQVEVDYQDRPQASYPPIAASDADLVELINQLARTQGQGERVLTPSTPNLNLRLPDGSRLAASYGVTARPHVVIRRHRILENHLSNLVAWGTIDPILEAFLRALIRARKNVILVGSQGVGKTSLLRAMAREIPATERVGTLESEYELWLHQLRPRVVAYEARESNGERGPDGRMAGEISLSDLFPQLLRMHLRRVIVGEVRSREVVPMLHAMNEGEGGSMCTLHARSARSAIDRIVTLCLEAGIGMTETLAYRLVAETLDFIVYIRLVDETALPGGVKHRFVSQILEITGIGEGQRPAVQSVFGPRESGGHREPRAVPDVTPLCIEDLVRAGFDRSLLQHPFGAWSQPIRTVVPL
ncbi:CpaF family protein [Streptacidiphilus sp. EB129]|uniref:CpaF family protein n=1 Tax=Streptacidiphilus sp. EB129 TaxID=3156262 RepID=UPI0035181522